MTTNYYLLLGLKQEFDISQEQLAANHLKLQKAIHPDNFANASSAEKLEAMKQVSLINDAFQLLKDPYQRGVYLLTLSGWQKPQEHQTIQAPELLMQQMSLRERFEEIKTCQQPEKQLDSFFDDIEDLIKKQYQTIVALFETVKTTTSESIYIELVRIKYFRKLKQEIIKFEEFLEDSMTH